MMLARDERARSRTLEALRSHLAREIVPIQIPLGEERGFNGVVDLVAMKNNRITERVNLQFRAEFFNVFNQVNLDIPNTNRGGGTFGTMPATAVPYTKSNNSKRYEGKLTGSLRQGHTLQGSFIDNRVHRANEPVLSFSIDRAALISPSVPNRLGVVNYNAALTQRMLLSAQYSQKDWATEGVGGTSSNILDSPFLTRTGTMYQYNAPYFDSTDPEERNNRQRLESETRDRDIVWQVTPLAAHPLFAA